VYPCKSCLPRTVRYWPVADALDVRIRPTADIHNGLLTLPLGSLVVRPTLTPALERYDNVKRRDKVHRFTPRGVRTPVGDV